MLYYVHDTTAIRDVWLSTYLSNYLNIHTYKALLSEGLHIMPYHVKLNQNAFMSYCVISVYLIFYYGIKKHFAFMLCDGK